MSYDRAHLSLITCAALLWGTTGVAVALLTDLTPTAIGFHRLAVAAVALAAVAALYLRPRPTRRPCRAGRAGPRARAVRRADPHPGRAC